MNKDAKNPEAYLEELPDERKESMRKLRDVIKSNLPDGFEETMLYGMISYVVPKSIYPPGYHVNPDLPLPFISIASQKNHIALYHSGVYADHKLSEWFTAEYPNYSKVKLDMGKSCIRFSKPGHIPYDLIAELASKISVDNWIATYESLIKRK